MDDIKALHEAGRVASIIRDKIVDMVKPGVKVFDLCKKADALIQEYDVQPSFPINVDINHVAAHYTSPLGDDTTIPYDSLVKIDLGTHVDGYIADTAATVCLDPELRYQVEAAEAALNAAINTIRDGIKAKEVGEAIEEAMRTRGYQPIRNLTGHKLSRYVLHAGKSIPNVPDHNGHTIHEGDVYAIEPFSVQLDASGYVQDGAPSNIYRFKKKHSVSDKARDMLDFIHEEYRTLPFASRWIIELFQGGQEHFKELLDSRCIMSYPQLIERSRKKVAQSEHTVIVTDDGCEVTTA